MKRRGKKKAIVDLLERGLVTAMSLQGVEKLVSEYGIDATRDYLYQILSRDPAFFRLGEDLWVLRSSVSEDIESLPQSLIEECIEVLKQMGTALPKKRLWELVRVRIPDLPGWLNEYSLASLLRLDQRFRIIARDRIGLDGQPPAPTNGELVLEALQEGAASTQWLHEYLYRRSWRGNPPTMRVLRSLLRQMRLRGLIRRNRRTKAWELNN